MLHAGREGPAAAGSAGRGRASAPHPGGAGGERAPERLSPPAPSASAPGPGPIRPLKPGRVGDWLFQHLPGVTLVSSGGVGGEGATPTGGAVRGETDMQAGVAGGSVSVAAADSDSSPAPVTDAEDADPTAASTYQADTPTTPQKTSMAASE